MPPLQVDTEENCCRRSTQRAPVAVVILGLPFHNVSFADTLEWVRHRVRSGTPAYIATVNMDFITQAWRDPELQRILLEADLVVADGIPIVWLSRLLGHRLKERVTGSDLVPMFAELGAREGFSLFGLGGAPGVAEKAMAKLVARNPGLRIAGCYSPPKADVLDMDNAEILARIENAAPDVLLVAFGAPKQEKWVNLHIRRWRVPVAIGIGGSLDFIAGVQKRAPRWVQRLALEWLWRMLSNPRRLLRRYLANIAFFVSALLRLLWMRYGPVSSRAPRMLAGADAVHPRDAFPLLRVAFPGGAGERPRNSGGRRIRRPPRSTTRHLAADREAQAADGQCPLGGSGFHAEPLEKFRRACEADPARPLLVDLRDRNWLDIRELGELLECHRRCRAAGRWMGVLTSHPRLIRMLRFVRLDRYLNVACDLREALDLLHAWTRACSEGGVSLEPDHRLRVVLPAELTAANAGEFKAGLDAAWGAADGDVAGVVVDAAAVRFLDSAGLGALVALRKRALPLPGGFRCFGFQGGARQTLRVARLEACFTDDAAGIGSAP